MLNNRRDFFRKVGQLTCLSAMIGGTALLVATNRVSLNGCDNQFCKDCQRVTRCSLEPAVKQRALNPASNASNK